MTSSPVRKIPDLLSLPKETTEPAPPKEPLKLGVVRGAGYEALVKATTRPSVPPRVVPVDKIDMKYLLRSLIQYNASDLHLKPDRPPLFRIGGKLTAARMATLTSERLNTILLGVLTETQTRELERKLQIDLSFRLGDLGRFRCNIFFQRGHLSAVIRMIPLAIPKIDELGLPAVLKELCFRPRGLVLVTGATGSGKSTTLAAMVQHMNENRNVHILMIEDPIEFVFRDEKASITQRELGADAHSLNDALYAGLRQDPDVIVVGELRDIKTIQMALAAAETGHLVLSTLHTQDAVATLERLLKAFPAETRNQVRIQLASSLVGVISQNLLVRADGGSRIPACEVLINSPTVENLILKEEFNRIPDAMRNSSTYYKMQTFNQDLKRLIESGLVSLEEGIKISRNPDDLKLSVAGLSREDGFEIRMQQDSDSGKIVL